MHKYIVKMVKIKVKKTYLDDEMRNIKAGTKSKLN